MAHRRAVPVQQLEPASGVYALQRTAAAPSFVELPLVSASVAGLGG